MPSAASASPGRAGFPLRPRLDLSRGARAGRPPCLRRALPRLRRPQPRARPRHGHALARVSWLDTRVWSPGPPPTVDFAVVTHLARSDDAGRSFRFVRAMNAIDRTRVPERPGIDGVFEHEVASLVREGPDAWQPSDRLLRSARRRTQGPLALPLRPLGGPRARAPRRHQPALDARSGTPPMSAPASTSRRWPVSRTASRSRSRPFSGMPARPGWPLLPGHHGRTRRVDRDRLVLLRQIRDGYELVGTLLDHRMPSAWAPTDWSRPTSRWRATAA